MTSENIPDDIKLKEVYLGTVRDGEIVFDPDAKIITKGSVPKAHLPGLEGYIKDLNEDPEWVEAWSSVEGLQEIFNWLRGY